jgi:hypothetical protein
MSHKTPNVQQNPTHVAPKDLSLSKQGTCPQATAMFVRQKSRQYPCSQKQFDKTPSFHTGPSEAASARGYVELRYLYYLEADTLSSVCLLLFVLYPMAEIRISMEEDND